MLKITKQVKIAFFFCNINISIVNKIIVSNSVSCNYNCLLSFPQTEKKNINN